MSEDEKIIARMKEQTDKVMNQIIKPMPLDKNETKKFDIALIEHKPLDKDGIIKNLKQKLRDKNESNKLLTEEIWKLNGIIDDQQEEIFALAEDFETMYSAAVQAVEYLTTITNKKRTAYVLQKLKELKNGKN